jgi:hypothetical protein
MRITGTRQAALIILAMLACQAQGQQIVYKSVDINGNVVYSDAPLENAVLVETITLPDAAGKDGVQNDADARIEQMANTTERLQQDREKKNPGPQGGGRGPDARTIDHTAGDLPGRALLQQLLPPLQSLSLSSLLAKAKTPAVSPTLSQW